MSATKKARTDDDDDFDVLRRHILSCPDVPNDSPAVQAALQGLDTELQRRVRDAKLKLRFANQAATGSSNATTTTTTTKTTVANAAAASLSTSSRDQITSMNDETSVSMSATMTSNQRDCDNNLDDDDWHDVATSHEERAIGDDNEAESSSAFGISLSKAAIAAMAEAQMEVETPTAAIALALHAALRSDLLGFACTGVPEDISSAGGFAPPIRELPKTQFVPPQWDQHAKRDSATTTTTTHPPHVTLRYRKSGTGSVLLRVSQEDGEDDAESKILRILLTPGASVQEPTNVDGLVVVLNQHINLDSFAAALKQRSGGVQPALHYKGLAILLTNFMNRFDLGQVKETDTLLMDEAWNPAAADIFASRDHSTFVRSSVPTSVGGDPLRFPQDPPSRLVFDSKPDLFGVPQIDIFDTRFPQDDFAGDLFPASLGGGFQPAFPSGNLMGPNHPRFHDGSGGGLSGVGPNSGFGMRPRFDPFGPPGGPTELFSPGKPRNRGPPGGLGEPNKDHMRPPNSLNNNNMFL